ncbi:MAG: sensor histidine kinase [Bacteroidetes bacterium]|nr:sensor histidine kinase [Bacteroidota bacterium]
MLNFRLIVAGLLLLICNTTGMAQIPPLKPVPGLPSSEVYDLFTDSKGFLWIAHNAGISKYDGINFTNFSNPEQSSLGTTNIIEDRYGRIWFINFSGQIFYIENGHMNLLKAYKSETESYFPRIGLLNDLLIATTEKGLFTCDTKTMKCHYEYCIDCGGKPRIVSVLLSILKDKVLAFGGSECYLYQPGKGLRKVIFDSPDKAVIEAGGATLCTRSYNDTAFLFTNPANVLYKLIVKGDTVKICGKKQFDNYINTVSIVKNGYWVNTINSSFPGTNSNAAVKGYDLSSVAQDKEGHHWYGSLRHGLLTDSVSVNTNQTNRIFSPDNGDVIKCMARNEGNLLIGTQNGLLITYNTETNNAAVVTKLPVNHGGITYIKPLHGDKILIGMPLLTYVFDTRSRLLNTIDPVRSLKQADQIDGAILTATASNLLIIPNKNDDANFKRLDDAFKGLTDFHYHFFGTKYRLLQYHIRSRAVHYSPFDKTIWVSLKNGLYRINHSGPVPFYYHNSKVYTSCLTGYHDKVIAGTFSDGVLIIGKNGVRQLAFDDGLLSNNVVNVKVVNDNLWVFTNGAVQIFDLHSLRLMYKYSFPDPNNTPLIDADELNDKCYFISSNGLYEISPVHKEAQPVNLYLNALFINRKDTGIVNNLVLANTSNDIQVSLGTPYLLNARDIVIKYMLATDNVPHWSYSKQGERNFHFASLAPGAYHFEAQAIKLQSGQSSKPLVINFTIRPPWWQTTVSRLIMGLISLCIIVAIIRIYYLNQLRKQQIDYEKKLIVERERQHISREIHDNIGQALSVIKLNLDMADRSAINDVKELIGEAIQDLRQFTHGLYHGKLLTDSVFELIKKDVERLNNSGQLVATLDFDTNKYPLNEQSELLIYRVFQETVNNILKHARANKVLVRIRNNKKLFKLSISDDGRGFPLGDYEKGLGIDSMYKRAELLKGKLSIISTPGQGTSVELTIDKAEI